jgi:hypothetical protein
VTKTRVNGDLTAILWKDKQKVNLLTNMHRPPAEGNFRDEYGNALKPAIVQDYYRHMGQVDKSDRMTNSYSIRRCTWKWMKKLFFHLLDTSILNSFILLTSCGSKLSHQNFRLSFVRDLIKEGGGCLDHRPPHGEDKLLPPVNLQDLT